MNEKLQRKSLRRSFLSLFLVLIIIFGGLALVSFYRLVSSSDTMLDGLWVNRSFFEYADKADVPLNEEMAFSYSLFFSVTADSESGEMLQIAPPYLSKDFVAATEQMTKAALADYDRRGFVGNHRFYLQKEDDHTVCIIFLDCEAKLQAFHSFLLLGVGLSILGMVIASYIVTATYRRAIREIARSNEKYLRYLTDSGHEFKTPIAIILADVDVLEMDLEHNEWVRDIRKQAKRLDSLTSNLGLLAQMENANIAPDMIDFSVSDVVFEEASSFLLAASRLNVRLDLDIQPMLSMLGSEKYITQLISVLLDNALKYAPKESEIKLLLEQTGASIHLSLTNHTNFSIPKESLPLVFDRFYRIQIPEEDHPPKGSGIGLSIAQAIVNTHHGKITAQSPEDKVFKIDIIFPQ